MAGRPRIVSFLPAATEMVCALGLADCLEGITHECDYPPEIAQKPVVIRNVLPVARMTQAEIDAAVSERLRRGLSLYAADEARIRDIAPDLILTQDLCQVCAPSGNEVTQLLQGLPSRPRVLYLTPKNLEGVFDNIRELGAATDRAREADAVIAERQARLEKIAAGTRALARRPRVFCMEWIDPVYCSGHWVPEMVRIAGGTDVLGREGAESIRISWDDVLRAAPEILIVMPCGYGLEGAVAQADALRAYRGWSDLPAVRDGRVYAVDASAYFARPGPRLVEGTELLAHLIHPERFSWDGPPVAFRVLEPPAPPRSRLLTA